jgi:hypothetical protein
MIQNKCYFGIDLALNAELHGLSGYHQITPGQQYLAFYTAKPNVF